MKKDEFFERFMFVPIIIIVSSALCIFFNVCEQAFLDDETYVVSTREEAEAEEAWIAKRWAGEKIKAGDNKIDINSASVEELQRLPGIGSTRSREIVEQRQKMGGFRTVEDLMCTEGIGIKVFENLREFICISK